MTTKDQVHEGARGERRPFVPALIGLALFATASVGTVSAAPLPTKTTSQTLSIPLTPTDWRPGLPASIAPLPFAKFDPALGDLLSITIGAKGNFEHQVNMNFVAPATITVSSLDNRSVLTKPDGSTLLTVTGPDEVVSRTYTGPTFPQPFKLDPTTVMGTAGPLTLNSAADRALFTAASPGETIGIPASASARSRFTTDSGNGFGGVNTRAGVEVTVSYEYVPIPEPSTLAILGLGAGILFVARRRAR